MVEKNSSDTVTGKKMKWELHHNEKLEALVELLLHLSGGRISLMIKMNFYRCICQSLQSANVSFS
jgi:hypothetical protein